MLVLLLLACAPTDDDPKPSEDCATLLWYRDGDGDGYGSEKVPCDEATAADVENDDDCDDADATIHPGAEERCNDGVDDNCDGFADPPAQPWYTDADGDGFGDPATAVETCFAEGRVAVAGDCDDTDARVNPDAVEVCDGVDDDCDGDGDLEGTAAHEATDGTFTDWTTTFAGEVDHHTGGTVHLCGGTWSAWLDVTADPLVVRGESSHPRPVLDLAGLPYGVRANEGVEVTLENLTLTGLDEAGTSAVYVDDDGRAELTDVDLLDNHGAGAGVAVAAQPGAVIVGTRLTVTGNSGAGIVSASDGRVAITDSTFANNRSTGGAGAIGGGGDVSAVGSTFTGNEATGAGGAVATDELTAEDCVFSGNRAGSHGGALYVGTARLTDVVLEGNEAVEHGGGVFVRSLSWLDGVEARDNVAGTSGGGLYGTAEIEASSFEGNAAGEAGGGVYAHGDVALIDSTVADNAASAGGGVYLEAGDFALSGGTITGNTAGSGGGLYLVLDSAYTATLDTSTLASNTATLDGGGLLIFRDRSSHELDVGDLTIEANTAGGDGGGVAVSGYVELTFMGTTLRDNTAAGSGGGVWSPGSTTTFDAAVLTGNAAALGGGFATETPEAVVLQNGTRVEGNTATQSGGGLSIGTLFYDATCDASTVAGNDPEDGWVGDAGFSSSFTATACTWGTLWLYDALHDFTGVADFTCERSACTP